VEVNTQAPEAASNARDVEGLVEGGIEWHIRIQAEFFAQRTDNLGPQHVSDPSQNTIAGSAGTVIHDPILISDSN
jgi:hypothetical protein